MVDSLSISSDGRLAISGSYAQAGLVLWDLKEGRPISQIGGRRLYEVRRSQVCLRAGDSSLHDRLIMSRFGRVRMPQKALWLLLPIMRS